MSFYSYIFTANYKNFFKNLRAVAKKEKRCFLVLLLDSIFLMLRFGFGMADYLNYELYKRTREERRSYFSTKEDNAIASASSSLKFGKADISEGIRGVCKARLHRPGGGKL